LPGHAKALPFALDCILLGTLSTDTSAVTQGRYDQVAGKAQSAVGSVKDAITSGADAVASVDLSTLGDDVAKLTQTVSDLVQKQTSSARDQVVGAVGAAADNISQATSAAQDNLASLEADLGARIQKNPLTAVAIAALVGLLIGKLS
jgi:ElaB/YqjD/DUF883 family membrane-anchored ribosome-binding protein